MNKIVSLYLSRKDVPARMDVVQGATDPGITFVLEDYEPDIGADAQIYVKKKESEVYNACTIDGNEVSFNPTTTTFDQVGPCVAQLEIISGGKVAVSYRIYVVVEPNTIDNEAIEATNEFTALQQALLAVDDITEWKAKTDQNTTDITAINNTLPRKTDFYNTATTKSMVGQATGTNYIRVRAEGAAGDYSVSFTDKYATMQNSNDWATLYTLWPVDIIAAGAAIGGVTSYNVPTDTWKTAASFTLNKGSYITFLSLTYVGNSTGYRRFCLSSSQDSEVPLGYAWADSEVESEETGHFVANMKAFGVLNIGADNTTYYVNTIQTSGGKLTCYPRWSCVKVKGSIT